MGVKLEKMLDRLPAERRRQVEARAATLIAEEMTLRENAGCGGEETRAEAEERLCSRRWTPT